MTKYPEDYLEQMPDRAPPEGARCVRDLIALVEDNQRVTFVGAAGVKGEQPHFLSVRTKGGYLNNGLPAIEPRIEISKGPTQARRDRVYQPLASLGDFHIQFNGDPAWMADLYSVGIGLFLIAEPLLQLISDRDPGAFESLSAPFRGRRAPEIGPYWLVMPRVLDAIDISRSSVLLRRPEVAVGYGKFVTHVTFLKGHHVRRDLPNGVCCFVDEFSCDWFWSRELIQAAADAGIRGLLFGYGQVELANEIRFQGPNDPAEW